MNTLHASDDLHIWVIPLKGESQQVALAAGLLSPVERQRSHHFYTADLQRRFILRRAALRRILARYVDRAPADLIFAQAPGGKPYLAGTNLHFNLSHTGDWAVLGIAQRNLGLDVETVAPLPDLARVAQHHFSVREQRDLFALPPAAQTAAFYRCWTRKEAFIKADGRGLGLPLTAFDVTLTADEPPAFRRIDIPGYAVAGWHLVNLTLPAPLIGAVAVRGTVARLHIQTLAADDSEGLPT